MNTRYVPFEKMSPKAKREYLRRHRHLWQGIKLCSRLMTDRTVYRRKGRRVTANTVLPP